jgi:hypothetical protein
MVRRTEPPVPPTPPDDGGGITHPNAPHPYRSPVPTVRLRDGRTVRLGRIKPKARPVALRLGSYVDFPHVKSSPPPDRVDYAAKAMPALKRMYLNDRYGCCVISGKAHALGVWSGNDADSGGLIQATDEEIYSQYQSICGPGDNGCVITQVYDVMRAKGFRAGGRTYPIDGYCAIDNRSQLEAMVGVYAFGANTIGIDLPQAWLDSKEGGVWDVTDSSIVGGHDVTVVAYNGQGVVISTWGGLRTITWRAFTTRTWVNEFYVPLAPSWYGNDKLAPNGIDVKTLMADLSKLSNGVIPDVGPPPGPVPPPPNPGPVTPPIPDPGPVPPVSVLFQLQFDRAVKKGKKVQFRAPVDIPVGKDDVTPAHAFRAASGDGCADCPVTAAMEVITPARPRRR